MDISKNEFINQLTLLIKHNSDEQNESFILSSDNIKYISEQMYEWYKEGGDKPIFEIGERVKFIDPNAFVGYHDVYFYVLGNAHRDKNIWRLTINKGSEICHSVAWSHQLKSASETENIEEFEYKSEHSDYPTDTRWYAISLDVVKNKKEIELNILSGKLRKLKK